MALSRNPTAVWLERREGKRGTSYRLRWVDPRTGAVRSEACGRGMALVRIRRDQIKQELRDGLSGKVPNVAVKELSDRLDTLMAGKSESTLRKTRDSLDLLDRLCPVRFIGAIDRGAVMDFRAKRLAGGVAVATVNKDLRQVRSAPSYAVDAGLLRVYPLLRWKGMMLREPEKRVRGVEENEFAALVKACDNPLLWASRGRAWASGATGRRWGLKIP